MGKIRFLAMAAFLTLAIVQAVEADEGGSVNVATFNLRMDTPADGDDAWPERKEMVKDLIRFHGFDVFGTQEGFIHQIRDILELPEYAYVGVGRDDGKEGGEHSAIFYRKSRFELMDNGDFWLSITPGEPSFGWDARIRRICSWAKFRDREGGGLFYFFSVHYDHEGVKARRESSLLMLERVKSIAGDAPFFCAGDFNATPESEPVRIIYEDGSWFDSRRISVEPPYGTEGTFHGFNVNDPAKERIDYIFVSKGIKVNSYGTLNDIRRGHFPSDHYPVMIKAQLPGSFSPVSYVNPLMGTESTYELSTGNTYPAIARPWGMNFWTPQTGKMGDGWAYVYTANKIRGFKQTHQPSPWINDYGQFSIMPVTGSPVFDQDSRASWFSHKGEVAKPHYYKVYLAEHDVSVEITPTERAAMFRFTFPETDSAFVVIDAFDKGSYIRIEPGKNRIMGYTTRNSGGVPENFRNYFVVEFDRSFTYEAVFADGSLDGKLREKAAGHTGAVIGFRTVKGETVHAKVASSFISFEQAELNMNELGDDSFDLLVAKGEDAWNDVLGRIEVSGGTTDRYRTFYSCLYRAALFPRKFYEYDAGGRIVHYSPYNGKVLPGYMFTDTGFWDTFRSLFPFLNLMFPSINEQIQEGLLNAYRESGFFPEWASPGHRDCMIGNNSASVLVDAYMKGVRVDDVETLYKGLLHGTESVHPKILSTGRLGYEQYNRLGYVPYDAGIDESAARTLEYAYDDWCMYTLANALGRPAEEIGRFAKRAANYRNVFDRETFLMRGRNADGAFMSPFSPLKWGDAFTEGNSWHYTWSVFHDPQGLIDLMGGKDGFVTMLDSVFIVPPSFDASYYSGVIHEIREMTVMNMGNYAHGNQPAQHMIYLYNYAGQPWKAQQRLRMVMDRLYTPGPDGYCGDEDNGQTSAWYVFSALGFYPVCPGTDEYVMGSPLFGEATLKFENGKRFVIKAQGNSDENIYISSASLNGAVTTKTYIRHGDLHNGGELLLRMSDSPDMSRGIKAEDFPYSFSTSTHKY
jgi:predicted alpha-1,2-mannosidase